MNKGERIRLIRSGGVEAEVGLGKPADALEVYEDVQFIYPSNGLGRKG